jgi:hypothetical protein
MFIASNFDAGVNFSFPYSFKSIRQICPGLRSAYTGKASLPKFSSHTLIPFAHARLLYAGLVNKVPGKG